MKLGANSKLTEMPDYSKGKIYEIKAPGTEDVYIGSTIKTLAQRMTRHRDDFKKWKEGKTTKHMTSFKIIEKDGAYIQLIEEFPCESKEQLFKREGEIIRANPNAVNRCIAGRSNKERYDDNKDKICEKHKQYYEINRGKKLQYNKDYYEANKEKIKQYQQGRKDEINAKRRECRAAKKASKISAENNSTNQLEPECPPQANSEPN